MFWIIGRGTCSLNLVRSLKNLSQDGLGLITTDPDDFASKTKYLTKIHYLIPPPQNQNYNEEVSKIIKDDDFITVGEEVFYIDRQSKYSSNLELLKRLHHKYIFYNFFPDYSNWIPKIRLVNNILLQNIGDKNCVIKSIYKQGMIQEILKKDFICRDKNGNNINTNYYLFGEWVVQEYFGDFTQNNYISSFSYALKGNILSHIVYRCNKTMYGFSCHRKIISVPEIDKIVHKLIDNIGYTGFIGLNFINKDKKYYILEAKPRITDGITFYDTFYLDKPSEPSRCEIITLNHYINKQIDLNIIKLKNDIFRWTDPFPMIYSLYNLIKKKYLCWINNQDYQKTIEYTSVSSVVKYQF
jgi:hypothetical protein